MLVSSLAVLLIVYGVGLTRLWRSAGCGRGITPVEASAFACGWVAIGIVLSPWMDALSDASQAAHMIQHQLLMVIAAPLIAVSAPLIAMLWAMPAAATRRAVGWIRRTPITTLWAGLTAPASVFVLHGVALWLWHIPALYDYALDHEAVHVVQHACFFGTAGLFWWGIAHGHHRRRSYGAAVVYVFATAVQGGLLGALLTISPRVWYVQYLASRAPGLTPLEDQQLAGLLMWIPASLIFVGGGLVLFAGWLNESGRRSRYQPAQPLNSPH